MPHWSHQLGDSSLQPAAQGVASCVCARARVCVSAGAACVCVSQVTGGSCRLPIPESSWWCKGTTERGLAGLGGVWDLLRHRPWLNLVFLHAGVDTTSGPPHLLVLADRVLPILQKGA